MIENTMRIGEIARAGEVTVETVRYYERMGLLEPAEREPTSSYRAFSLDAVKRLHFIRRAQSLGFSLHEIGELLDLRSIPGARAVEVREKVEEKLADVRQKIEHLERMADSLEQLSASCDGQGDIGGCAILDTLDAP